MSYSVAELRGIDGEALGFEWNSFSGFQILKLIEEIQDQLQKKTAELENFTDRIIFMSMFNDIDWTKKRHDETCISISVMSSCTRRDSRKVTGRSLVLEMKSSGMELEVTNLRKSGIL